MRKFKIGMAAVLILGIVALFIIVGGGLAQGPALPPGEYDLETGQYVFNSTIETIPIIGIVWDDASNISRLAAGADNWPATWADDGDLYTAYGDGWGFIPQVPNKLSMGFAKVSGNPYTHTGINITPSDGERTGDGSSGTKASGMLMVDSVLYMWVRNVVSGGRECQIAKSDNYAINWTFASWHIEELGYCTFINFGQNYAGARDDYVYMVSHNWPQAYQPADGFVLTRVSKNEVMLENSYEFFSGFNGEGKPTWSTDVADRKHVSEWAPKKAFRSGISYNAGLGRYIWWQKSTGLSGGAFRLQEAPEPWGPWTTFYETDEWDVSVGETGHFPPKWMSDDGLTIYLIFSGDDSFSVRKAELLT